MYTHTVTVWWPGQVIVLSYQLWPLCQSPRYDLHLHPFLCACVCVWLCGHSMVKLKSCDPKLLSPFNCFLLKGLLRGQACWEMWLIYSTVLILQNILRFLFFFLRQSSVGFPLKKENTAIFTSEVDVMLHSVITLISETFCYFFSLIKRKNDLLYCCHW